jgi:hypothetical protein
MVTDFSSKREGIILLQNAGIAMGGEEIFMVGVVATGLLADNLLVRFGRHDVYSRNFFKLPLCFPF